jgi:hypothetical protein
MMTVILDGYNVIHAVPELSRYADRSLLSAREALVRWCQAYRVRRGDIGKVYVVFDGRESPPESSPSPQGSVAVVFARKPEEADARILKIIETQGRGRCVVVSNDNQVANNARAFGARVISVQTFALQARPARGAPAAAAPDKAALPARDARQITEDYRKHLERRAR